MKTNRPAARQFSWLVLGDSEFAASFKEHQALKKDVGGRDYFEVRRDGREELEDRASRDPILKHMLEAEPDPFGPEREVEP